jgi:hypothetical protein
MNKNKRYITWIKDKTIDSEFYLYEMDGGYHFVAENAVVAARKAAENYIDNYIGKSTEATIEVIVGSHYKETTPFTLEGPFVVTKQTEFNIKRKDLNE